MLNPSSLNPPMIQENWLSVVQDIWRSITMWGVVYSMIPVVELSVFLTLTFYAMNAARRTKEAESNIRSAPGYKIRCLFLKWISCALIIKVILLSIWILVEGALTWLKHKDHQLQKPPDGEASLIHRRGWIRILCRLLPNLLFLTSYLLVVGLWINVTIKSRTRNFDETRVSRFIVVSNLTLYVTFGIVTMVEISTMNYDLFREVGFYVIGVAYLILFVLWTYWGRQCLVTLRSRRSMHASRLPAHDALELQLPLIMEAAPTIGRVANTTKDPTQRRMGVLVPVGSTVFLLKGVYNILVATGVIDRYVPLAFPHTSHLESRLMWDGLFGCITEAMPVAMVVYLTSSSEGSYKADL
eukprot:GHVH01013284.1.p1 GENE.GHVH01013284.1~~GHVH01013284.1.p1  ORF type:complete len:355 (-),score=26.18 GHVH01013284.1:553-1617(-)